MLTTLLTLEDFSPVSFLDLYFSSAPSLDGLVKDMLLLDIQVQPDLNSRSISAFCGLFL
ncbi:hypothetical protein Gohar_011197 [Gossypium harknessii]|uniref:Uncharacterized protein n=1 Tax=Gossypium harknessii TaxID=34285 RepID=A0A7J9GT96_9ROSI|nr:hypothetical protein [Gossypium harknessii]